jgi:hypothetical protein
VFAVGTLDREMPAVAGYLLTMRGVNVCCSHSLVMGDPQ